jgi:hypothetical protein
MTPRSLSVPLGAVALEATVRVGAARPTLHRIDGVAVWGRDAVFFGGFVGVGLP